MALNGYLGLCTFLVKDYDEAIAYFCDVLGFDLVEDEHQPAQNKRWVVVSPFRRADDDHNVASAILLAKAKNAEERACIGNQTGGRVGFFLHVRDFDNTYDTFISKGVNFLETPRDEAYGKVVVFSDLYGNKWDLLEAR